MHSENQVRSLRKLYNRTLWSYIGIAALSVAATAFLVVGNMIHNGQALHWVAAAWVGLALAAVEYFIERTLYKKGKKGAFILPAFMMGLLVLYVLFMKSGLIDGLLLLFYPLVLGFVAGRPLIPAIGLLRDAGALRDGDLSEAVGRIKAGTHRKNTESGRDAYVLFEDELTHEVRLLRMSHISPLHRYRVFYLPHSGLAVGEVIPDNVTFDPFGNPIEREVEEPITEKPDYTEESYTVKPDYTEEGPAEKPWYQNPEAFSNAPPKAEHAPPAVSLDPSSPERVRAASLGKAAKVCRILTFVFLGWIILGVAVAGDGASIALLLFALPSIAASILAGFFKDKELKLRCTRRTTAFCVDTVRRRSGKTSVRHPIVEYEVKGVTYTAELSFSCSRNAVGETFPIDYDPLDPNTVRAKRRGLFR